MSPQLAVLSALVGLCLGSFGATLAARYGGDASAFRGRSRCPGCGRTLGVRDLVPIVSYLALRRRCRTCAAPIRPFYPLSELAFAAIGAFPFLLLPIDAALLAAALGWWLACLALIDLEHMLLPDALTLPLAGFGLAWALAGPPGLRLSDPQSALIGCLAAYAGFCLLAAAFLRLRGRAGLGGGDAKLMAAGGAWLGASALPNLILVAALLGLAHAILAGALRHPERPVPFGPAIGLAFWLLVIIQLR